MKIGFIGLGHMGQPMAMNCLQKGHELTVFDKQGQACFPLVERGAIMASSVGEAAREQDLVITMLQNHEQVNQCCMESGGVFDSIKDGVGIYLDCSTVSITASRELHAQAKKETYLCLTHQYLVEWQRLRQVN